MTPDVAQRSVVVCALGAALLGGVVGWIAAFSGLGLWGLIIGLTVTVIALLALARGANAGRSITALAGLGFAFILLTWPLLWLVVGYVRYAITGTSLGD
jgi:hypothetical protein